MSLKHRPNRSQRVLRYLVSSPKPLSVAEILQCVEPSGDRRAMWGCVSTLERAGKIVRRGGGNVARFAAAADALVDRRVRLVIPSKPPASKTAAPRKAILGSSTTVPTAAAFGNQQSSRSALGRALTAAEEKRRLSEELARDVAAYHANGGKTQHLRPGESAQSIREAEAARKQRVLNEARVYPRTTTKDH